ncbi:MAG: branched-chain amino acid ABC transporter permease, partial [Betaproteobacteria bacterium]|nr:branched-chain amino acid ABC transporter permease [Betaproteobacteria bacterium]
MGNALCITDPGAGMYIQWIILSLMGLSAWLVLQTGRISLGQQAYFGIGAYAASLVTVMWHGSLWLALVTALACGALFAAITSQMLRALKGLPFALATLAVAELVRLALSAWTWRVPHPKGFEVGPDGVHGFREIRWLFENQIDPETYLSFNALALTLSVVTILCISQTKQGLAIRAVGLDTELAEVQGESVQSLQALTQTWAGGIGALAGALYAHQATYVEPAVFDVMLGIHAVGYAMLGGLATPLGPLLGSAFDLGLL